MKQHRIIKWISCIMALLMCVAVIGASGDVQRLEASANEENTAASYAEIPVKKLRVGNLSPAVSSDLDYTDWWYSELEKCRFLFLPATADRSDLTITYETKDDQPLYLGKTKIVSGEPTGVLGEADEFQVTVGDTDCGTLRIMQSNLGCVFINTPNGSLEYLDSHPAINETGSTLMLSADGDVTYSGELAKISPHGNSSWSYSAKKSYNLKLPQKENLFGLGKAKRWVLISNHLDNSMIRNKIVMEMSREAGMEYVMDTTYVDLYSDGSYRGTYMLSERVQIQKQRINIVDLEEETEKLNDQELNSYPHKVVGTPGFDDVTPDSYKYYEIPNDPKDITGGYLLQFQLAGRYGSKAESGFITSRGQPVEIDGPEYASEAQVLYIRNFIQEMEDAIYSGTGYNSLGKHYSDYLDVDSMIIAYLVQEVAENHDGTKTSFYMWKDSDLKGDGKLHFGPAWDFDLSIGNGYITQINMYGEGTVSNRIENLYVAGFPIEGYTPGGQVYGLSWIAQLYKHGDIVTRVANMYAERFVPYVSEAVDKEDGLIRQIADSILPSARMNNARWLKNGGSTGSDLIENVESVRSYLERRKDWLDKLWMPLVNDEGYFMKGDVNADGIFGISDVVVLQRWLLRGEYLPCWRAGDLYEDGVIDVFDLCFMKRELIKRNG